MTWPVTLLLDEQAYPLGVVQRAVYSLAHQLVVEVRPQGQQTALVAMPNLQQPQLESLSAESARSALLQQLNDFALREQVRQETAGLREILARAALAAAIK